MKKHINIAKMKFLKLHILILNLFLMTFIVNHVNAQEENSINKVEQFKIAYITKELNLTPSEAEKFWPMYNEMVGKLKDLRKDRKIIIDEINSKFENIKEDEAKRKLQILNEIELKEVQIKKEYGEKLTTIIGFKKTLKLYNIEQEFKKELLKKLKDNGPNTENKKRPIKR